MHLLSWIFFTMVVLTAYGLYRDRKRKKIPEKDKKEIKPYIDYIKSHQEQFRQLSANNEKLEQILKYIEHEKEQRTKKAD